jgi:signal transduction histidine kinase
MALVAFNTIRARRSKYLYISFLLAAAVWCVSVGFYFLNGSASLNGLYAFFIYSSAITISITMLYLSDDKIYLGLKDDYERKTGLIFSISKYILTGLTLFTILIIAINDKMIIRNFLSKNVVEVNRSGYIFYIFILVLPILLSAYRLFLNLRRYNAENSKGPKIHFLIIMFCYLVALIFNVILPYLTVYSYITIGPIVSLMLPLATLILRGKNTNYQLFDIRTSAFRAVGYTFSLLAVSFISSFTIIRIILPFTGQDSEVKPVVYLISFVSLIFISWAVPRFRKFFDKFTYPIFYRNNYNPTLFAEHMAEAVTSNPQTTDLQRSILKLFNKAYGAQYIQIVVNRVEDEDPHHTNLIIGENLGHGAPAEVLNFYNKLFFGYEQKHKYVLRAKLDFEENSEESNLLSNNNIGMITKLKLNKRLVGYIVFGEKTSGTLYTLEDVDLVKNHYSEIAVALQNAVRYNRIKQFNLELQEKVNVATAKLKKSNARLRKLDKAKDDFLSIASHQLRTPLTVVRGNISLVAEGTMGKVSPQAHDILVQSERSAGRLADLINDFLSTSRLKTGKFILDPVLMDLGESVEEEYERLKDFAAMRGVELIMHEIPADLPEVMADASKIRQVLLNTIDNAIYYSPRRSGKVEIMVYSDGNSVIYKVKDNGIGVPAREKHKMFTRMYRAENAKGVRPDGNGLGLFLMKKIIDAHNGTIIFESKEGVGSTFGFKIDINPKVPLERSVIT